MSERALTPAPAPDLEDAQSRLAALETRLAEREAELAAFKTELRGLQDAYLDKMGAWHAQLAELDAAVADMEIRAGLRPAVEPDEDDSSDDSNEDDILAGASRPAPSDDLRRVFRDVAKAIHPDLAPNDPARYRRHSLMAEANRAYANRDEDRLRLILHAWQRNADVLPDDRPGTVRDRILRDIADIDARLLAIDIELADLRRSAIWQLKIKVDAALAQGWDLFNEMAMHIKREISRANARLAVLRRTAGE
ncbi:MAG TPA: hypothetical protein VJN96_21060 [Vicinamibacterales bacterium]|nr:hypothetical protein [Vicinamibacterales bacterium]